MREMDIGRVARDSGLPASTLRYYEEKGLIRSIGRNGLRRVFDESVLQRLALIALGRTAGFSLDAIAEMLAAEGGPAIDREQLERKADQLDQTIKRLSAIRDGLRHAAVCPAENHLACAKFQRLMGLAAKQVAREKPEKF
ncbi:helix-turn-helix domain-containing protein [Pseudomonas sp. Gutcm_11s]|uniref:helix-turn-helix domain-containing protein n=1 Tax=Pseudomonas sp. Gutcm_11s TaxID=3026088 RepID=UPI00236143FF|nr:helix-turn-helix domain-containing protein [Pseudomonas sp. Gutcm_11s]MDD0842823.1 helix-turn-helix domain-containing protein [Pseudomonas sp. Gutcm_11s]